MRSAAATDVAGLIGGGDEHIRSPMPPAVCRRAPPCPSGRISHGDLQPWGAPRRTLRERTPQCRRCPYIHCGALWPDWTGLSLMPRRCTARVRAASTSTSTSTCRCLRTAAASGCRSMRGRRLRAAEWPTGNQRHHSSLRGACQSSLHAGLEGDAVCGGDGRGRPHRRQRPTQPVLDVTRREPPCPQWQE